MQIINLFIKVCIYFCKKNQNKFSLNKMKILEHR